MTHLKCAVKVLVTLLFCMTLGLPLILLSVAFILCSNLLVLLLQASGCSGERIEGEELVSSVWYKFSSWWREV